MGSVAQAVPCGSQCSVFNHTILAWDSLSHHIWHQQVCVRRSCASRRPQVSLLQEKDLVQVRRCCRDSKSEEGRGLQVFAGTRASTLFLFSWPAFLN